MSFLVLHSSLRGRDSWFLCFSCLPGVLWLLVFCGILHGALYAIVVFPEHTHLPRSEPGQASSHSRHKRLNISESIQIHPKPYVIMLLMMRHIRYHEQDVPRGCARAMEAGLRYFIIGRL